MTSPSSLSVTDSLGYRTKIERSGIIKRYEKNCKLHGISSHAGINLRYVKVNIRTAEKLKFKNFFKNTMTQERLNDPAFFNFENKQAKKIDSRETIKTYI